MYPSRDLISLSLLGALAVACSSAPRLADAPEQVGNLVAAIERVDDEAEQVRAAVTASLERLRILGRGEFGGDEALAAYSGFLQSIDAAEQQALRFGEAVEDMQAAAAPMFAQWSADLGQVRNERLHERGESRLARTRARYDAILNAAAPAREQLAGHVQTLRDHATLLAHDLNASALAELREDLKRFAEDTRGLDGQFDLCQEVARAYVESAALPTAASPVR